MKARENPKGYITTRTQYKTVKKYDHKQFDEFCTDIYMNGYKAGQGSVPAVDVEDVLTVIGSVKGVGPSLGGRIRQAVEKRFRQET